MQKRSYSVGLWAVFKDRASTEVLGYFRDGVGVAVGPGQATFKIDENALFAPDGERLGYLAPLDNSWAVNLGDHSVGHVLRAVPG